MQPIILPTTLQPLQSFGGSEVVRTNSTTATYYLADRTNRGIIVVNATNMTYKTLMKPVTTGTPTPIKNSIGAIIGYKGADPTGGFIGASIYATGPSNQGTGRIGNVEEVNSGPNSMAVYENPGHANDQRWMLVTDGACQINNNGGGYSSPAGGGSMRSCSTPADPSVAGAASTFTTSGTTHGVTNYVSKLNPLLSTANCTNPGPQYLTSAGLPVKTVCYPQSHQSNVKLFDLKTNTWIATFPTGGGCIDNGYQNAVGGGLFQVAMAPCTAPLGLYAPPSAAAPHGYSVTGKGGQSGSFDVKIGVDSHDGKVYVLVANPDENTPRGIGCQLSQVFDPPTNCAEPAGGLGPTTGANGGCSENAPAAQGQAAPRNTFIQPWDDVIPTAQTAAYPGAPVGLQGQTMGPYMTLFTMDPATGYLYYQATIKIDDHNSTNGPAIPPGVAGPKVDGQLELTSVLPNARQMIVESGFRGCDNKGRHGPEAFAGITWNPQAGVGGAFMVSMTSVQNNPPICYIASLDNLCGPPTTNPGTTTIITAANASTMATVPPGPGAFSQNFQGQSYIPGPWIGCNLGTGQGPGCQPGQGGSPAAGGCNYPSPTPPPANLIGSINNQANGGFNWACDGALAMIDPVYVYKGAKQPNILTKYPMFHTTNDPVSEGSIGPPAANVNGYYVPVGQPYDGITDANNTFPFVLAACPNFKTKMDPKVLHNPLLDAPGGAATCPNGLQTVGPLYPGAAYPDNQKGIVFQKTEGSIGGVVYLPYCSGAAIELGPTDIPGGWNNRKGKDGDDGDVSSLTKTSTGRDTTFANLFLGCDPRYNGNFGTGQGQLTVNIQENYSLVLNTLSATSQAPGCTKGTLGLGCRSVSQSSFAPNPFVPTPLGLNGGFNDFYLPGPFPPVNPLPLFAHLNPNNQTPVPAGCTAQYPATPPGNGGGTCGGTHPFVPPNAQNGPVCSSTTCPLASGNQVMAGYISGPNIFNAGVTINGITEARFNMSNATKDPHWWVVVGGRGWTAGSIAGALPANLGPATRAPVIAYIDALTNVNVEYIPTSSGSDTIALDEQNYVAFVPVNGVQNNELPHGDFTGNGARLCGNTTTRNGHTTGPGCIVVFKQQYLSPLGGGPVMGN